MYGDICIDFETQLHLARGYPQHGDFEKSQEAASTSHDYRFLNLP